MEPIHWIGLALLVAWAFLQRDRAWRRREDLLRKFGESLKP